MRAEADRIFDEFRKLISNTVSRGKLANFSSMSLMLSHGDVLLERDFSVNDEYLVENLFEQSLVTPRVVYDAIHAAGGTANFDITPSMLLHTGSVA